MTTLPSEIGRILEKTMPKIRKQSTPTTRAGVRNYPLRVKRLNGLESPYRTYPEIGAATEVALDSTAEVLVPRVACVIAVLAGRPVVVAGETAQTFLLQILIHKIKLVFAGQEPVILSAC